jgi:hypoxanthine phosphoribosyltransferase
MHLLEQYKVLFSKEEIKQRVLAIAHQINTDYKGKTLDIICLVNSAQFFCADLVRELTITTRLHTLGFSSYLNGNESGEVRITLDINEPLYNCHLLVIEGIIISGRTPRYIIDLLKVRRPASIAMCALGIKPALLSEELPIHYSAFEFGQEIAVGYGIGSVTEKTLSAIIEK